MNDTTAMSGGGAVRDRTAFFVRLLIALAQALALYLLVEAASASPPSWPATDPRLFIPLLLAWSYVPLILMLGLSQVRPLPLAAWAAIAAAFIIGLGYHDAVRGQFVPATNISFMWARHQLWLVLAAALFVAHVLVVDSLIERRFLPPYARHFDTAWKLGVQIVMAKAFVLVFWGVLVLGAGLFKLVNIEFFVRLIQHSWFYYPATTLALAVAIHVTDVQPSLIRGARSLALTLLSWLLPLLVVILLGFLGSLPFISLDPLWRTHFATTLLLTSAALLVFLINSFYQDGTTDGAVSRIKKTAAAIGAVELIPLVGLAGWALSLRVGQYGWSVERIFAAAVIAVATCYAVGYAVAVVLSPKTFRRIEITNFATAYVFLGLTLALFTPLADPARLMVADQVARLKSGFVRPEKFDFAALKFDGAGWGHDALVELTKAKDGPDADRIGAFASRALAAVSRNGSTNPGGLPTGDEMAARIAIYPAGKPLPPGFLDLGAGPFTAATLPTCLRATKGPQCILRFMTLRPGGAEAILFLDSLNGHILETDALGRWHEIGRLSGPLFCNSVRQALERGEFSVEPHLSPDLVVGNQRLDIFAQPDRCTN
jgi:hypothetical protein